MPVKCQMTKGCMAQASYMTTAEEGISDPLLWKSLIMTQLVDKAVFHFEGVDFNKGPSWLRVERQNKNKN